MASNRDKREILKSDQVLYEKISSGRASKNFRRRLRRKRSLVRYRSHLRRANANRDSSRQDLCSSFAVFDITDSKTMDLTTNSANCVEFQNTMKEVADWHQRQQISYWKSRAISLELQNKMLLQHIRDCYAINIEEARASAVTESNQLGSTTSGYSGHGHSHSSHKESRVDKVEPAAFARPLPKFAAKERKEEMHLLYGDEAQKLMGMETAIQLNFDYNTGHSDIPHWPNIPINMTN